MVMGPEDLARRKIDRAFEAAGWIVQDEDEMNLTAGQGIAVREFRLNKGHGRADYLLFVEGQAVGVLEAKKADYTLSGVEGQVQLYGYGLPDYMKTPVDPLPFLYVSNGVKTRFANLLDPTPRSRDIFALHRPETLAEWLEADSLREWQRRFRPKRLDMVAEESAEYDRTPSSLRSRLQALPAADELPGLWPNQQRAIVNLEESLAHDRPRALIQMATGSGKSRMAVASIYRLIKFGGARRVLFLVDRTNLGQQAEDEFASYRTYDDHRKLTELYTVQRLTNNTVRSSAKVVITTIQRLYSMLQGEPDFDPELEEESSFAQEDGGTPVTVGYSQQLPPEFFDVIFIDECHRSIYTLWRQVLEYFDAHLVGLTATPAKHTFGFFNRNLVMEYSHEDAVADGVNVSFDIYRIRTQITAEGSTIEAGPGVLVRHRDRRSRADRWERPDTDISYSAEQLDRSVVAEDQIRLILKTFKEKLFVDIFPGRTHVPKTLIFAKDDSHAEDIVEAVRMVFDEGNDFCSKITYKTTGAKPHDLIQAFRTSYYPRIAVSVDMVTTGTDVRPIEIVLFMRSVKSRTFYDQMWGRGVRVSGPDELQSVTPGAHAKTHFMLIDCVGVTESPLQDTRPLERSRSVSFKELLKRIARGSTEPDIVSSLAGRLGRLRQQLDDKDRRRIAAVSPDHTLGDIVRGLISALDFDGQVEQARKQFDLPQDVEPTPQQVDEVAEQRIRAATAPLASQADLRKLLIELKQKFDQIVDEISEDVLLEAGPAPQAKERAKAMVQSFKDYLEENKEEIEALQFFYSARYHDRLRYADIRALADAIGAPPRNWTPETLWRAYQQLDASRVRGASSGRLLTDIVSLVGFALGRHEELVPYDQQVGRRFETWLAQQETAGRTFDDEQRRWLEMMRDHVARSLEIEMDDFDLTPFVEQGGLGRAGQVFEGELGRLIRELNEVLAA